MKLQTEACSSRHINMVPKKFESASFYLCALNHYSIIAAYFITAHRRSMPIAKWATGPRLYPIM